MKKEGYHFQIFLLGMLLIGGGAFVLLLTRGRFPVATSVWPLLLVFAGMGLLFSYSRRGGPKKNIFFGLFFLLSGFFTVLLMIMPGSNLFDLWWPGYLALAGVSFLPYGQKKKAYHRPGILISGLFLMGISFFMLLFSLDIIPMSFRAFVQVWWPVLFIAMGLFLALSAIIRDRKNGGDVQGKE